MEENTKKMLAGEPYRPDTAEISKISKKAHRLCLEYNRLPDTETTKRNEILKELIPNLGKNVYLQGPIQIDHGFSTHLGDNFYANFNLTILDTCPVTIGNNVMCGPNVTIATPFHPLLAEQRNARKQSDGKIADIEYGAAITIGDDCWLASNVIICPGVTIGNGCVIGAGSVVTKDIPDNSLVLGVPGKVVRKIDEKDRLENYPY